MKKLLIALLVAVLVLSSTAIAEYRPATASPTPPPFGWVKGVVTDATNAAVKLANVTVSVDGKTVRTDAQGCYEIQLLLGTYTLSFSKEGYVSAEATVTVQAGKYTTKNCALQPKNGLVRGVVSDATDPSIKIGGATVIASGKTTTTNSRGEYELTLPVGSHTLTFTKEGYIQTTANVSVQRGGESTQDCSMSKELSSNEYRVVLTWGETPRDLDSHLLGKSRNNTEYHVWFPADQKKPVNAYGEAELDVDDISSYGPETVTFTVTNRSTYVYYVLDFTNRENRRNTALSNSGAKVEVYSGNQRVKVYTVPSGMGIYWEVFRIENGTLITVDQVTNNEPTR